MVFFMFYFIQKHDLNHIFENKKKEAVPKGDSLFFLYKNSLSN